MGYWGLIIGARTERALDELETVTALEDAEDDWAEGLTDAFTGLDGWRFGRIYINDEPSEEQMMSAAREIGGPFFVANVADSDFAHVHCADPVGGYFSFMLHEKTAAEGYQMDVDRADQEAAVDRLVTWAGGTANVPELRRVLAGKLIFVEDTVFWLAAAVGALPLADLGEYMFGDDVPVGPAR